MSEEYRRKNDKHRLSGGGEDALPRFPSSSSAPSGSSHLADNPLPRSCPFVGPQIVTGEGQGTKTGPFPYNTGKLMRHFCSSVNLRSWLRLQAHTTAQFLL